MFARNLEIWSQSGFKAQLEIKARRQRNEKEARNEQQVEDDDDDDDDNETRGGGGDELGMKSRTLIVRCPVSTLIKILQRSNLSQ